MHTRHRITRCHRQVKVVSATCPLHQLHTRTMSTQLAITRRLLLACITRHHSVSTRPHTSRAANLEAFATTYSVMDDTGDRTPKPCTPHRQPTEEPPGVSDSISESQTPSASSPHIQRPRPVTLNTLDPSPYLHHLPPSSSLMLRQHQITSIPTPSTAPNTPQHYTYPHTHRLSSAPAVSSSAQGQRPQPH